ncbi:hypothetical protein KUCAC02_027394, partial [Chaenocephalus aceratus]
PATNGSLVLPSPSISTYTRGFTERRCFDTLKLLPHDQTSKYLPGQQRATPRRKMAPLVCHQWQKCADSLTAEEGLACCGPSKNYAGGITCLALGQRDSFYKGWIIIPVDLDSARVIILSNIMQQRREDRGVSEEVFPLVGSRPGLAPGCSANSSSPVSDPPPPSPPLPPQTLRCQSDWMERAKQDPAIGPKGQRNCCQLGQHFTAEHHSPNKQCIGPQATGNMEPVITSRALLVHSPKPKPGQGLERVLHLTQISQPGLSSPPTPASSRREPLSPLTGKSEGAVARQALDGRSNRAGTLGVTPGATSRDESATDLQSSRQNDSLSGLKEGGERSSINQDASLPFHEAAWSPSGPNWVWSCIPLPTELPVVAERRAAVEGARSRAPLWKALINPDLSGALTRGGAARQQRRLETRRG